MPENVAPRRSRSLDLVEELTLLDVELLRGDEALVAQRAELLDLRRRVLGGAHSLRAVRERQRLAHLLARIARAARSMTEAPGRGDAYAALARAECKRQREQA